MRKIHVIVQSKKDYYNEQYLVYRFIWWIISSVLFTSLVYVFTKSFNNLGWILFGFIFLFAFSDLTKNQILKAYINAFLGFLYAIWGILFIIISVVSLETSDEKIFGFVLAIIFFANAYGKIKKYTNLFNFLFGNKYRAKKTIYFLLAIVVLIGVIILVSYLLNKSSNQNVPDPFEGSDFIISINKTEDSNIIKPVENNNIVVVDLKPKLPEWEYFVVTKDMNITDCNKYSYYGYSESGQCRGERAVFFNNPDDCLTISERSWENFEYRNQCLVQLAVLTNNLSLCDLVHDTFPNYFQEASLNYESKCAEFVMMINE